MSEEKETKQESLPRWSWGAFMFDPAFIIGIRKYTFLLLYLLYLVPLINLLAIIGIKVFLGLKGHEMAQTSATFENEDERRGYMKAIDHAGFVLFIVMLVFLLLWSVLALAFAGSFFGGMFFGDMMMN